MKEKSILYASKNVPDVKEFLNKLSSITIKFNKDFKEK